MRKELDGLALLVDDYLYHGRHSKTNIAKKLNISRQGLYNFIHKDNFTIDDANRILSVINCRVDYMIVNNIDNNAKTNTPEPVNKSIEQ